MSTATGKWQVSHNNYHVEYENFYYSVDYSYAGNPCSVRATKGAIEVFVEGQESYRT